MRRGLEAQREGPRTKINNKEHWNDLRTYREVENDFRSNGFLSCLYLGKRMVGFQHDIGIVIALFIAIAFAIGRISFYLQNKA